MNRILKMTLWAGVATILLSAGVIAAYLRFTMGLGATTNLSDTFPWGLWIGFDFLGVGIAAAGFTIVASVHLFHLHRFEPIVRPAILTAFVGYLLVILVLVIDLGRPEHFWHPLVMWNPHSVMFEITWCVICYTTVLSIEFLPVVLEKFRITTPMKILRIISTPLMIFGVIFSTLHQSSFGSLYLIVPGRLHELWYSPLLPVLFFISCIAAGLSMIIFESYLIERKTKRPLPHDVLSTLGKVVAVALAVYLVVRVQDMAGRGVFGDAFVWSYQSGFFLAEVAIGFLLPMILLMITPVRESRRGLFLCSILVILGFATNRMNTAITGMEKWPNQTYFPSFLEILIVLGIATLGFVAFYTISTYFPIFGTEEQHHAAKKSNPSLLWLDEIKSVSQP
ncbi:MAG TPA: Ni/Fe-hydrogenase cytochrome b subunit [Bacteroidota bacterium]|nr:Ni/Fe-hydrogenase cytochrome b subunit [Bacteroidota bacterium]